MITVRVKIITEVINVHSNKCFTDFDQAINTIKKLLKPKAINNNRYAKK